MKRAVLGAVGVLAAGFAIGCGGGDSEEEASAPTPKEVIACFEEAGAKDPQQRTENGNQAVVAMLPGAEVIGAEFTGTEAKTEEALKRFEKLKPLLAFEAAEGQIVGVVYEPKNEELVRDCLE